MNAAAAYARLSSLGVPVVRTSEAAALLGSSPGTTAQMLRRLAQSGLIKPLRHGQFWVAAGPVDPWLALDFVAAPYPAYGSLYSVLYLRGALSQLPTVLYAVTLGRTQRVKTTAGTYSFHQLTPELFGGFEALPTGAKLATLEKALFDLAYFGSARSRRFARPPELELPSRLDRSALAGWLDRVRSPVRREYVLRQLNRLLRLAGRRAL